MRSRKRARRRHPSEDASAPLVKAKPEEQGLSRPRVTTITDTKSVLALQGQIGNHAVQRILATRQPPKHQPATVQRLQLPGPLGKIQDKVKGASSGSKERAKAAYEGYTEYRNDQTRKNFDTSTLKGLGTAALDLIQDAWKVSKDKAAEVAKAASGPLVELFHTAIEAIKTALTSNEFYEAIAKAMGALSSLFNTLMNYISPLMDALSGALQQIVDVGSAVLPFVGAVIKVITSIVGAVMAIYKSYKRFKHLKALIDAGKNAAGVAAEVGSYGVRKVLRAVIYHVSRVVRNIGSALTGLADIALDIAAIFTLGGTEVGKLVTLLVNTGMNLYDLGFFGFRATKGIYKMIRGTRGKARVENAEKLLSSATNGDDDSQNLMVKLGIQSLTARIERTLYLGNKALMEDIKEGAQKAYSKVSAEHGISEDEAFEFHSKLIEFGEDNLESFKNYVKSRMKDVQFSPGGVITLVKSLIQIGKEQLFDDEYAKESMQEEFEQNKDNPKWETVIVGQISGRLKSTQ